MPTKGTTRLEGIIFQDKEDLNQISDYVLCGAPSIGAAYLGYRLREPNVFFRVWNFPEGIQRCIDHKIDNLYVAPMFGPLYESWMANHPEGTDEQFLRATAMLPDTAKYVASIGHDKVILPWSIIFSKTSLSAATTDEVIKLNMSVPEDVMAGIQSIVAKSFHLPKRNVYVAHQVFPVVEHAAVACDRIIRQATDALIYGHRYTIHEYDEQIISQEKYRDAWDLFCIQVAMMYEAEGNRVSISRVNSVIESISSAELPLSSAESLRSIWTRIARDAAPYKPCKMYTLFEEAKIADLRTQTIADTKRAALLPVPG